MGIKIKSNQSVSHFFFFEKRETKQFVNVGLNIASKIKKKFILDI